MKQAKTLIPQLAKRVYLHKWDAPTAILAIAHLGHNQLVALPPDIKQLQSLRTLDLTTNQFTVFPSEVGQLKSLESLNLSSNQLKHLLPEIGQLQSLKSLDLSNNQLMTLPAEIGCLQSLQSIDLSNNQLTALPFEIGQLRSLQSIDLNGNPIQDLSALNNHPSLKVRVQAFGLTLPPQFWTHVNHWEAKWLVTETNSEIRRLLIRQIGYDRLCEELATQVIDSWREYTLLKVTAKFELVPFLKGRFSEELMHLLKMTCPSTGHVHALRVPPTFASARAPIRWANWGVDPTAFAVET